MPQCMKCHVSIPEAFDEESCPNCAIKKKADRVDLFPKPKPVEDPVVDPE